MFSVQLVNSTAITLVAYDYSEQVLRVVFRNNTGYEYEVEEEIFEILATAESVGAEFHKLRLRSLPHRRLEGNEVIGFVLEVMKARDRVLAQA